MRLRLLAATAIGLVCAIAAPPRSATFASGMPTPMPPGRAVGQTTPPKEWGEIAARLTAIESAVAKLAQKSDRTDFTPGLFGLGGVLVGGLINWFVQRGLMAHQRSLANNAARIQSANSFVQWQLQQLSELYGPLHALLRQSNAMYRHMNLVLAKAAPQRFRLEERAPGDDFDKKVFEIHIDGQWVRFRTIMHIGDVYGKGYGIEDYFDELVAIGERMVKVIEEKAGYARPEQKDLSSVFGRYLAHYSVLRRLHASVKPALPADRAADDVRTAVPMVVDQSAVFPREIQGLVDAGFDAINEELRRWRSEGTVAPSEGTAASSKAPVGRCA